MSTGVESEQCASTAKGLLQFEPEFSFEEWKKNIRAHVTALKCHIMASHGLSPQGQIVEPYSPDILMKVEHNSQYLKYGNKDELDIYVKNAIERLPKPCLNTEPCSFTNSVTELENVHLSLESESSAAIDPDSISSPSNSSLSIWSLPKMSASSALKPLKDHCSFPKETLEDEVDAIRKELQVKVNEVEKLSKIRDEVENELQELTANLFQEAHSMVLEANQKAASAQKSFKEANMQVEVLQAEVSALKALVITSTPASPNPHLHPQLISRGAQALVTEASKIFHRGHKKSPSDFDLKYGRDTTPPSSPLKDCKISAPQGISSSFPLDPECWEVDPVVHKEFVLWREDPSLTRDDPFMSRVYTEDIDLCLSFPNSTLAYKVQRAIDENALYIEEVNPRQHNSCPKKCVLLEVPRYCKYRFRLGEKDDNWYYISQLARNRIIAVCEFLSYLRYIKLGLVKSSIHDVYWDIVKRRREMALARLGF